MEKSRAKIEILININRLDVRIGKLEKDIIIYTEKIQ